MNISRRAFLQAGASGTALLLAAAAGLLPRFALAAVEALGGSTAQNSADIDFQAPEIAENGAVVPLVIESKLPGTRLIAIVSEKNPHALSAVFHIPAGTEPYVMTRVKIAETSDVTALVQTDQGFFYTDRLVKVTLGGCGG